MYQLINQSISEWTTQSLDGIIEENKDNGILNHMGYDWLRKA